MTNNIDIENTVEFDELTTQAVRAAEELYRVLAADDDSDEARKPLLGESRAEVAAAVINAAAVTLRALIESASRNGLRIEMEGAVGVDGLGDSTVWYL